MIEIVFWDLGNVLFKIQSDHFLQSVIQKGGRSNIDKKEIDKIVTLSFSGNLSLEETIDNLVYITGCQKKIVYQMMKLNWIFVNTELINFINFISLRCQCRQGIISDLWSIPHYWIQKQCKDIFLLFDSELIFFSNLTGFTKRDDGKQYFIDIVKQINLDPKEICLVDDDLKNLDKAREFGMSTIQYARVSLKDGEINWQKANELIVSKLKTKLLI